MSEECKRCHETFDVPYPLKLPASGLCGSCADAVVIELKTEIAELVEIFEGNGTPLEKGCTLAGLLESLIADRDEQTSIGDTLQADVARLEKVLDLASVMHMAADELVLMLYKRWPDISKAGIAELMKVPALDAAATKYGKFCGALEGESGE